jgi:aldose 1-epimerase
MKAKFITLKNKFITATITNYGARLAGLLVPDKDGRLVDVVAGFKTVNAYLKSTTPYYGATIGRFANRIALGKFSLNGVDYQLPVNNGPNSLHGGSGFHSKVWDINEAGDDFIVMHYFSPDGEDGYPGDLEVKVTYRLTDIALEINYEAISQSDTIINLTNHAYFNLNGEGSGNILGHTLQINANAYTRINQYLVPTGQLAAVANGPFDFRLPKTIGQHIDAEHEQLQFARGYDHNYVLDKTNPGDLALAAKATGDLTGISMEVMTTEPGMQLYTGNFMTGNNTFKCGAKDGFRTTFCLETQHFPDSPNHPAFPSTVLKAGEIFKSSSIYRFGANRG